MEDELQVQLVVAVDEYARHASELCELAATGNPLVFAMAKQRCLLDVERIEEIKRALQRR